MADDDRTVQVPVSQIANELEYRVRTAVARWRAADRAGSDGGAAVDAEVRGGRASILALLSQLPVSLPTRDEVAAVVKRAGDAWTGPSMDEFRNDPPTRRHYAIADAVRALLSQSIPTTTSGYCPDCGNYGRAHGRVQDVADGPMRDCRYKGVDLRPAEPPRIEDLAPGTRFVGRHVDPEECGGVDHTWFVIRPGARPLVVSDEGQHWSGDSIDPSTIRNVTPPEVNP